MKKIKIPDKKDKEILNLKNELSQLWYMLLTKDVK